MEQRTCNIIMCAKSHCRLPGADGTPKGDTAAYLSDECACPIEDYGGTLLEQILVEAFCDYLNGADRPGFEARQMLASRVSEDRPLADRILTAFQLTRIRKGNNLCNGFTEELIAQSRMDLGEKICGD